ncbi:hypothetical protein BJX76DRAFT_13807 [Aspergillus varians]
MTQRQSKQDQQRTNGVSEVTSPFLGSAPEHNMTFNMSDVVDVSVPNVTTTDVLAKPNGNAASAGFRTDADISGNLAMRERTLKRWEPGTDANADLSLESTSTATKTWDQFETNARLFGATSSYNEDMYTTRINRSDPAYKQKEAEAARIAREIETSEIDNAHVREERGLQAPDAGDEEDKYSGVRRDEQNFPPLASGQPNKYTPPALRNSNQITAAAPPYTSSAKRTTSTKENPPTTLAAKDSTLAQPLTAPAINASPVADTDQKASLRKTSSTTPAAGKAAPPENNYEIEVVDRFRIFANNERSKLDQRRRNQAAHDRTIKLNELMKFSQNFKLATPVPKDLVPILAKDPHKQEAIIQRAQHGSEDKKTPKSAATTPTVEQKKTTEQTQLPNRQESGATAPQTQSDRPSYPRGRQGYPPTGPQGGPGGRVQQPPFHIGRQATGMLGHRLADNLQQRKGAASGSVPTPLPIQEARSGPSTDQSNVPSPNKVLTPTSSLSTKFNVKAMEFKPNPAASTFTPGASNPTAFTKPDSRARSPSTFFGTKKPRPISERPSLKDQFNPIKRMKKESAEQTERNYTSNGGIPFAYNTPPTWFVATNGDEEKSYVQMFKSSPASPQGRTGSNPQIPHQPHLPYQFQQTPTMPSTSGPPHGPHLHPQQHHGSGPPHFDDPHRMQMSASTSQMFPSPRLQHGYPSPMAPHAQLAFGQQPVPQFFVNQGAPQPAHMRHYQGAPQFVNPQGAMSAAPMMVQQPSGGPYMGVPQAPFTPQMQMYSPNPTHAYPHVPPPQPHGGYPSPSRAAPMMMHQNSQPGQPPQHVMYMSPGQHQQPVYAGQQPGHSMLQ